MFQFRKKEFIGIYLFSASLNFMGCGTKDHHNAANQPQTKIDQGVTSSSDDTLPPATKPSDERASQTAGSATEPKQSPEKSQQPLVPNSRTKTTDLATQDKTLFPEDQANYSRNRQFAVKVIWMKGPVVGDANEVQLIFADQQRFLPKEVTLERFKPWMKIHGHGGGESQMVVSKDADFPNVYHASGFYPVMAGSWVLQIAATVNGISDTIEVPFEI